MKIWSISSVNVAALKNLIPDAARQYFAVQFRVLVGLDGLQFLVYGIVCSIKSYNFTFTVN